VVLLLATVDVVVEEDIVLVLLTVIDEVVEGDAVRVEVASVVDAVLVDEDVAMVVLVVVDAGEAGLSNLLYRLRRTGPPHHCEPLPIHS
jgi:hypothetical protein